MSKWQFNYENWSGSGQYGPLLTGVRRNARGMWLGPLEAPQHVLEFLAVEPAGAGSTNYCYPQPGSAGALKKLIDRAGTSVRWQIDTDEAIRGTVEIKAPPSPEVPAWLARAANPDAATRRMMKGEPEKYQGGAEGFKVPSRRNGHGEIVDNYTARVDLKWSLWTVDKGIWDEYAPGVWEWMRAWFDASLDDGNPESAGLADAPRVVSTGPWKEIRFGTVAIEPGRATVHLWAEFDSGSEKKAPDLTEIVEAETFEELMALIDQVEERLIEAGG